MSITKASLNTQFVELDAGQTVEHALGEILSRWVVVIRTIDPTTGKVEHEVLLGPALLAEARATRLRKYLKAVCPPLSSPIARGWKRPKPRPRQSLRRSSWW